MRIGRSLATLSIVGLQALILPGEAKSAPVWEWYKYIFPVCWFGNDCFQPPIGQPKPPPQPPKPPVQTKSDTPPYYAILRVYCVDVNDTQRDRGDNDLTVRSKISTAD